MKINPLFDRVVILPQKNEDKTKSGIFLATASDKKSGIGEVVSVGEGGFIDGNQIQMKVKKGDKVLYSLYAGTEITFDKTEYIIIRQTDIYGILE